MKFSSLHIDTGGAKWIALNYVQYHDDEMNSKVNIARLDSQLKQARLHRALVQEPLGPLMFDSLLE
ncbi:hypothetical protein GCM10009347_36170 [Shewanella algicola]|nr:hypothetical protein GCM10009347_36170 [Shewanella algicola]